MNPDPTQQEQAKPWSATLPNDQGYFWHWNGDEDCAPVVLFVMYSGTADKYFVCHNFMTGAPFVEDVGGFWYAIQPPSVTPTHAPSEGQMGDALSGWLLGKLADAERSVRAREQAGETLRGGTDKSWREAADMHPSTAGKVMSKAQRLKAAEAEDGIAKKCRREVAMFKAAIALHASHSQLAAQLAAMREAIDDALHDVECGIYPFYLDDPQQAGPCTCWKSKVPTSGQALLDRLKVAEEKFELYAGWSMWKPGLWRISFPESGPSAEFVCSESDFASAMRKDGHE